MGRQTACAIGLLSSGIFAILCWMVMFAAGTDVWHDTGRPDFWNSTQPPYPDIRVFLWAYYLLFPILLAQIVLGVLIFLAGRKQARNTLLG
jgi:hypothetical protein